MTALTQERLKELLYYDPFTGIFTWLVSKGRVSAGSRAGWKNNGRNSKRYLHIKIDGKNYKSHRLAFLYMEGKFPNDEVDHINQNSLDNVWSNLREATRKENSQNVKLRRDNKTGIPGIHWHSRDKIYDVSIGVSGKRMHIGYCNDFFEACCAKKTAELKYNVHSNHGSDRPL